MKNEVGLRLVPDDYGGFQLVSVSSDIPNAPSPSGRKLRTTYLAYYDNGHNRRFSKEKEIDQFARIQSFEDSCLLSNIINRCANGDVSVLQKVRGMYCDTTGLPCDSRSAHDLINRSRGVFDGLSKEEKARYHDDFSNFIGSFGNTAGVEAFIRMKNPDAFVTPENNVDGGNASES